MVFVLNCISTFRKKGIWEPSSTQVDNPSSCTSQLQELQINRIPSLVLPPYKDICLKTLGLAFQSAKTALYPSLPAKQPQADRPRLWLQMHFLSISDGSRRPCVSALPASFDPHNCWCGLWWTRSGNQAGWTMTRALEEGLFQIWMKIYWALPSEQSRNCCPSQTTWNSHVHTRTAIESHLSPFARNEDWCGNDPNTTSAGQYIKSKCEREGIQHMFKSCRACFKRGACLNKMLHAKPVRLWAQESAMCSIILRGKFAWEHMKRWALREENTKWHNIRRKPSQTFFFSFAFIQQYQLQSTASLITHYLFATL